MKTAAEAPADATELRRRARQRLRGQPRVNGFGTKADTQRILQELQIHQIELELQNEELAQAKAEADAALEKYTDLYDFLPVGYFSLDAQGLILEVNFTGATMLGTERSRLTGRRFQLFVAPKCRVAFQAFLERIFSGREKQTCETLLENSGRTPFWADLEAKSVSTAGGVQALELGPKKWCRVAVIDIAARKEAEMVRQRNEILVATNRRLEEEIAKRRVVEKSLVESERNARVLLIQSQAMQAQLRDFSHRILQVQEKQRAKISRELHDDVSQLLIGINVHLAVFTKAATAQPSGIRRRVVPLRRLVKKTLRVVHQFARDLRPAALDDLGLIPALRSYLRDFPKKKGLQIRFAASTDGVILDNDMRIMFYRVAQEALTNAAKHARATLIQVTISKSREGVSLEIADNGRAFDVGRVGSVQWSNHLGLVGMRERVEMVGGRLSVVSERGTGTTIRAEVAFGSERVRS
jgi:PAS domain S-box-containing protein